MSFEAAFGDDSDKEQLPQGEPTQAPQEPKEPAEPVEAGAPPAPDTEKHVPLAALEAERKGRQDWKEKALRLEGEMKAIRDQQARQPQGEQPEVDPVQAQQYRLETVILNASEKAARKEYGTESVDKAFERMEAEFAKNPALYPQIMNAADPWDELVKHGQRLMALDEIGTDPTAYRKRIEDEIRASLSKPAAQAINLPASLADARSSGTTNRTWTGPAPMDSMFPN